MRFIRKAKTINIRVLGILAILVLLLVSQTTGFAGEREYQFTDMHLHYVNFVLETQGFKNLFKEMDKNGIQRSMVFGLGYAISWPDIRPERVSYYADEKTGADNTPPMYFSKVADFKLLRDFNALEPEQKDRIFPLLQGLNVMDRNEIYYVLDMFKNHPELCGIGELLIHKGVMNNVTALTPSGNSFAMAPVFDFAAFNGMPVLFHQNITDEKSTGPEDQLDQIYMKEIVDILLLHPETTFIWAHTGISRNLYVKEHIKVITRLLNAHPKLHFDISWFVWDAYIKDDLDNWADLIIKFPDRFMLGSDKIGNFSTNPLVDFSTNPLSDRKRIRSPKGKEADKYTRRYMSARATGTGVGEEMTKYIPLLERIEQHPGGAEIADNLAHGNIDRLLDSIPCGCKSGKPVKNPWKNMDPWKLQQYARPVMQVSVKEKGPIAIAVNNNYANLEKDIRDNYYRWDMQYRYTGNVEGIVFPKPRPGIDGAGVTLFKAPGYKQYSAYLRESPTEPFPAQSVLLTIDKSTAFKYGASGAELYPNGNWPTLPWWDSESKTHGKIAKVMVPEGNVLILYDDEYFRGNELTRIKPTSGKFVGLKKWADKTKSFQFIPVD